MGPTQKAPDLVAVVEAAYTLDVTDGAWLKGVVDAMRPSAESGLGMAAYLYDTSQRPFRIHDLVLDCPIDEAGLASLLDSSNDEYVRASWLALGASTASEVPGYASHPGVHDVFHPAGIHDVFVVNSMDPVGIGCWIGAPLPALHRLEHDQRERWNRVSAHIRSALRLRLRLRGAASLPAAVDDGAGEPEAVLTRDGGVEHAEPTANDALGELRRAVLGMERARRELRANVDEALTSWKALVQGRWTLVDEFQAGGSRYIVARANAASSAGPAVLTPRERQVANCVAMGLTNKEVAYELGLSHSTVRVLVARACARLGAKNRNELIAKFREALLR